MSGLDSLSWSNRNPSDQIVVLTGAGVSMNAGFPGGPDLVRALLNALATRTNSPNLEAIDTISKRLPLETVFQIARDHLGTPVIEQIISKLDGGSPTPIHQAIAFLAEDHLVRRLYTLNFDTLHERAFRSGPTKVKAIGQSVLCNIRLISGKVFEIVKLHGSADSIGIITLAEYVAGFDPDIKKLLMHDLDASHWLVLGYGGWDVDIHHFLATAIESGIIPSEVLWIDRSFPDAGGRTELLRALSEAGTISHSIVGDVQVIAEGLTSYPLRRGVTWDRSIDDLVEHVKEVEPLVAVATLSECAILSGKAAWAANLLSREKSSTLLRERAFLAESMGNYADAAQIFARLAKRSSRPETRALAATRAFLYSKGEQNVFDQITVNVLPQPLGRAFETFRQTRRTDVGGLERERMRELVRALPSFDDLAKSILNLDAVRLYVSIISESARITHEARDWSSALTSDIAALRFANSIGDQDAIAMCAGNIGACHMGLAEDASKTECSIHPTCF